MKVIRSSELASDREFFEILHSSDRSQIAVMNLAQGQVSGEYGTDHPEADQTLFVLDGAGTAFVEEERVDLQPGDIVHIPAGARHQITGPNRTLNVYSPVAYPEES